MTKRVKAEALVAAREPRPQKEVFELANRVEINASVTGSLSEELERLLIFDSRMLNRESALQLLGIVPQLRIVRRAWSRHFATFGCISCRRKKVIYAAGGFCDRCYKRLRDRLREAFLNFTAGRDTQQEIAALVRKSETARQLLSGDDR